MHADNVKFFGKEDWEYTRHLRETSQAIDLLVSIDPGVDIDGFEGSIHSLVPGGLFFIQTDLESIRYQDHPAARGLSTIYLKPDKSRGPESEEMEALKRKKGMNSEEFRPFEDSVVNSKRPTSQIGLFRYEGRHYRPG